MEDEARIRDGVELVFLLDAPTADYLEHGLDRHDADDVLLASMLGYRQSNPDEITTLVSDDAGIRVKARQLGLKAFELPDQFRLASETDARDAEVQALRQELQKLQGAIPRLDLEYLNGAKHIKVDLAPPPTTIDGAVENWQREAREKFPIRRHRLTQFGSLIEPLKEEFDRYNMEVEDYLTAGAAYLQANWDHLCDWLRTFEIDLVLVNNGTDLASDIDTFLHFPDGMQVFAEDDLPPLPEEPAEPTPPRTLGETIAGGLVDIHPGMSGFHLPDFDIPDVGPHNVGYPVIKRVNSYEVGVHVERLKQNDREPLGKLYVAFDDDGEVRPFEIGYRINAVGVPTDVEGDLAVVVAREAAS